MKKKLSLASFVTVLFVLSIQGAFAQTVTMTPTNPSVSGLKGVASSAASNRLTKMKTNADTWITERLTVLNNFVSHANSLKINNSSQVTSAVNTITTIDIPGLTQLKTQIDAVTDPTQISTLVPLVKEIFTTYRVYAVQLPKDHGMVYSGFLSNRITEFTALETKMTGYISKANAKGKDITKITADQAKVTTDVTKLSADNTSFETTLANLTPAGYPGTDTTIATIKSTTLPALHADFLAVKTDITAFTTDYKSL